MVQQDAESKALAIRLMASFFIQILVLKFVPLWVFRYFSISHVSIPSSFQYGYDGLFLWIAFQVCFVPRTIFHRIANRHFDS